MNGRIRIIKQANVTTVIRTRSATGQSRMMRITRIVQNGASIERARKAAPRAALNAGSKSARGSAWALHGERASAKAGSSRPGRSGSSCGRQREGNGLQSRQIELTRRMVDIQAHDRARLVEVDVNPWRDLARFTAWGRLELDVETVRLGVVVQLHSASLLKFRSKNALCKVSPSSSVTTLSTRGTSSPGSRTSPQKRIRPSLWTSQRSGAAITDAHHARSM